MNSAELLDMVMRVAELVRQWGSKSTGVSSKKAVTVSLPLKEAAQVLALTEMYPGCSEEQIVQDLVCAALADLEEAFPYEKGSKQIAEDELGDPIYEDRGLTSVFLSLSRKYKHSLRQTV